MAEQDTTDLKEESTQSIILSQDPARDEHKQEETDCAGAVTEEQSKVTDSDSPPTPADGGAAISSTQGTQPTEVEGRGLDNKLDVEKSSSAEHNDSHGDHSGNAPVLTSDNFSETIGTQENNTAPLPEPHGQERTVKEKAEQRSGDAETTGPEEKTPEPTAPKATGIHGEDKVTNDVKNSTAPLLKTHDQKDTVKNEKTEQNSGDAQTIGPEEKTPKEKTPKEKTPKEETPEPTAPKAPGIHGGRGLDNKLDVEKSCSAEHNDRSHGDHSGNAPVLTSDNFSETIGTQENNTVPLPEPHGQERTLKEKAEQRSGDAETIGPKEETPQEETLEPTAPKATGIHGANVKYWMLVVIVALCSVLLHHLYQSETPPEKKDVRQVDIFLRQLEIVKTQFPSQRSELWRRSRIHLARHLQTAQPTEPVSLILTAGTKAEGTLRCLAQALASAFSAALNSSVLHIDGASKANQDSDQVKLDIDSQLRAAFESDKPVAVVHRFDELPPASTLIFYRYCDHENAAYKKTSLMFTVLLGGEDELPAHLGLSAVEEMVDDQLKKKFLSSSHTIAFDRMDLDKYGGLWSRISHLILPVASEKRIEHDGC